MRRSGRTLALTALALLPIFAAAAGSDTGAGASVERGLFRLVASDLSGVTIDFHDPEGTGSPRGTGVALPVNATGALRVLSGEPGVHWEEIGILRDVRVGRVRVDPGVRAARIRVDFQRPPDSGRSPEPGAGPGGIAAGAAWAPMYRNTFLNASSIHSFPGRPRRASTPAVAPRGGGNPEFRLRVGVTGLYAVTVADLRAAGWPESVPAAGIRLFEKSVNSADPASPLTTGVPILIQDDTGEAFAFDAEDRLLFLGRNADDRFRRKFADSRYTRFHTYWLTWGEDNGERMVDRAGWFEATDISTPASFPDTVRFEENLVYVTDGPSEVGNPFPILDTHYWIGTGVDSATLTLSTPGLDPNGVVRLRARWQGYILNSHFITIRIGRACSTGVDTMLADRLRFERDAAFQFESGPIDAARFTNACWPLELRGSSLSPAGGEAPGSGALLDYVDVTYPRRFALLGGRLAFHAGGLTGNVEFAIRGLARPEVLLFETTEPGAPRRIAIAAEQFHAIAPPPRAEYEVRFRVALTGGESFEAVEPSRVSTILAAAGPGSLPIDLGPAINTRAEPASPAADTGADVLVLCPERFQAELEPLLEHRRSQGHRITVASPQDVWDQFSGGDKSVPAIRDWLRHVHRTWVRPPDYLLLAGDASEDYRGDLATSDPDWVPTMMRYAPVPGLENRIGLEGSDNYFVGSLAEGDRDGDVLPEMFLGRLPVGSEAETRAVVDKLLAYDVYAGDEAWRRRGLVISDDQYSDTITGSGSYCYRPEERSFEAGGDSVMALLSRNLCAADFACEHLKMSALLDSVPDLGRQPGAGDCPGTVGLTRGYVRSDLTPQWIETASRGHLFQSWSGHSSRVRLATETLVEFSGQFTNPANRNPEQLTNVNRPFIFLGIGCHVNEFEHFGEAVTEHAIGEAMLLLPNRGAIASIGSTAFELIQTNRPLQVYLARALFTDLPVDPDTGRRRRILGEGKDEALVRLSTDLGGGPNVPGILQDLFATITLLGDPTMPIDMEPARFQVRVNGEPVSSGDAITAETGSPRARIEAVLTDDVDIGTVSVQSDSRPVPETEFSVEPDTGNACGRRLVYEAELEPASYTIVLTATDWRGRPQTFPLEVRLPVTFTAAGRPLGPGQVVPPDAAFGARLESPVSLSRDEIELLVNGRSDIFSWTAVDHEDRVWEAANSAPLPEGHAVFELRIRGETARTPSARFEVEIQTEFTIREAWFYPNPWPGGGPAFFTYSLNYPADARPTRGEISIFTVSGRTVARLPAPVEIGRNRLDWAPADTEGDPIANGVYIFKLAVLGKGETRSFVDRLVIHR